MPAFDQHGKLTEDDVDNCNRESQYLLASTEALPSSISLQNTDNTDKSYPVSFDLARLKTVFLSPPITVSML